MAGICVEKIGSIQVFLKDDGTYDAYDYATNTYIPDPYKDKPKDYKPVKIRKSKEQIAAEIAEIAEYQTVALPDRKLKKESLEYFGVKIGLSEQDGTTPVTHYYPYTCEGEVVGYKVRLIENKRMWSVGDQKEVDLFGWDQAIVQGAKRLYITEGELDAVALYQIFKDNNRNTAFDHLNPAIVSLPHGAGSASRDLVRVVQHIKRFFKEVVLVFDQDDAGKAAIADVMAIIPDAVVATLPAKDANACLIEGRAKAAYAACVFNAQVPKNSRIVSGSSLHEKAKEAPKYGLSWPWQGITEATRGFQFGQTIYIGAAQKMGKSELVNTIGAHCIKEHGLKVFMAKPEENNAKTYKLVAGKLSGKFFHDPKKPFDLEAYEAAGKIIGDNLFLVNLYQHLGWETLKADIREAAKEHGCKVIMIDPITNLTNGLNAADANTKLQEIAQELAAMALDLNVVIFIFCHLRNPDG